MPTPVSRKFLQELCRKNARLARSVINFQPRSYHHLANEACGISIHNRIAVSSSMKLLDVRNFSDKAEEKKEETSEEGNDKGSKDVDSEASREEDAVEEVSEVDKVKAELKEMKDQLLRSLAEQENIRGIAKRDVENARQFAVTSFAKSLLDTSDNLTRAMDAVPEELRKDTENHPVLATLYEGIQMTDDGLTKAFTKNKLSKFGAAGDKFDPNLHEALFEYPDENMEAGAIGQVMKVGFMLNKRVIRPAEVGVIKKA